MTTWFGGSSGASDQTQSGTIVFGQAFSAPASGNVTQARGELGTPAGSVPLGVYIYAVSGAAPGALLGQSDELTIPASSAVALRSFTFSTPVAVVSATSYFLMFFSGGGNNFNYRKLDTSTGTSYYRTPVGTYPTAPNPFGASTNYAGYRPYLEAGIADAASTFVPQTIIIS